MPGARAVHHDQLGTDAAAMRRRIVEFHRNRDRYFRKHGMSLTRIVWKACWTWAYLVRALAAALAARAATRGATCCTRARSSSPAAARAIREAAEAHNRALANNVPRPPWSTLTPPNWPRSAARSARCSCCSPPVARARALLLAGLALLAAAGAGARVGARATACSTA